MSTLAERFWSKVNRTEECWVWTAGLHQSGYGRFYVGGKRVKAHRFAYESEIGPVPEGLELDHLCRNLRCVRPDHLEAVTHQENVRRGMSPFGISARKTECPQGHPYDEQNTYVDRGRRRCRKCLAAKARAERARRREQ